LNRQNSRGKSPCHIVIDSTETCAVVTNYEDGVLAVFPLLPNGSLNEACQIIRFTGSGPNIERQMSSHAHSFFFDRRFNFGFACDLGSDRVMAYRFDLNAAEPLAPVPWLESKPGAGPRHGLFSTPGRTAYVVNELDSTVDVLSYDGRGCFQKIQSLSTLSAAKVPCRNTAAAIKLSPGGHFLYCSNRDIGNQGRDSIACFKVSSDTGALEAVCAVPSCGKIPRDFAIDPSGDFLVACNQDSDNVAVFRIDHATGSLTLSGEYAVPSPVCVIFQDS
jgi:6-phosphogluconolactonase